MTTDQKTEEETRNQLMQKLRASSGNNLPAVAIKTEEQKQLEKQKAKDDFQDDYDFSRKKLRNLLQMGEDAVEHFKDIAMESEEPGMFRAFGELLKNTSDIATAIMDTAKKKSEIDVETGDNLKDKDIGNPGTTNVFIGSTKDLLEKVKREASPVIDIESK